MAFSCRHCLIDQRFEFFLRNVRANSLAKGPAREILQILRSEVTHRLVLSQHILVEVARVLANPQLQIRYRLSPEEIVNSG